MTNSPFHAGELAIQTRAGVRARAERLGAMFRDFMPDQHRQFFEELPFIVVGSEQAGAPEATILAGAPGFIRSPDPRHLVIAAPSPSSAGAAIGLLGIQPWTRRRNRMNGTITATGPEGFTVEVGQSFGNCPQYITPRLPEPGTAGTVPARVEGAALSPEAAKLIDGADTFFIASAAPEGIDVSHRGGPSGFVQRVERDGASLLVIADYRGNNAFNTLGNILVNPRAGLLFADFASGDLLQLRGTAEVVWQGEERVLVFRVEGGVFRPAALPFRWRAV